MFETRTRAKRFRPNVFRFANYFEKTGHRQLVRGQQHEQAGRDHDGLKLVLDLHVADRDRARQTRRDGDPFFDPCPGTGRARIAGHTQATQDYIEIRDFRSFAKKSLAGVNVEKVRERKL